MNFHPEQFVNNLYYMGVGLLAIFVVIGLLIGMTALLSKLTVKKKTDEDKQNADADK